MSDELDTGKVAVGAGGLLGLITFVLQLFRPHTDALAKRIEALEAESRANQGRRENALRDHKNQLGSLRERVVRLETFAEIDGKPSRKERDDAQSGTEADAEG